MIFGYNTDVPVGDKVYHVQTEDRGKKNPVIDSVIYHKGQILDKKRTKYVPEEVTPERIKEMVTRQHRELIDSLKNGAFVPGRVATDEGPVAGSENVTVELLNPDSLEKNGRLLFRLNAPPGSKVEACLEVEGGGEERGQVMADREGVAEISFQLPQKDSATVLFRTMTEGTLRTLKFVVRQQ